MLSCAFVVCAQVGQTSIPADFIPLSEVAKQMSSASGEKYRLAPELEREVVYVSTKDKSVEHVRELVAKAYFSKWDPTASGYILKLDPKLKKDRDEQRAKEWKQKFLEKGVREVTSPEDDVAIAKYYKLNAKQQETLKRISNSDSPTDDLLRKVLTSIPINDVLSMKSGEKRHFSSIVHPYAKTLFVKDWSKKFISDSNAFWSGVEDLPDDLRRLFENSVPQFATANPALSFWIGLSESGATLTILGSKTKSLSSVMQFGSSSKSLPGWTKEIQKHWVYDELPTQLPLITSEPAELIFGRVADRVSKLRDDVVIVIPDPETIVRRRVGLDCLNDGIAQKVWVQSDQSSLIFRPGEFDRCLESRSNRTIIRSAIEELEHFGAISYQKIREFMTIQPMASNAQVFVYLFISESGHGGNQSLNFLSSPMFRQFFLVFDTLSELQKQRLLNKQPILFRELSAQGRLSVVNWLRDSEFGSSFCLDSGTVNKNPVRFEEAPIPFENELSVNGMLVAEKIDSLHCILKSKDFNNTETQDAQTVGAMIFGQEQGKPIWVQGYPPIKRSTFRPINCQQLSLTLSSSGATLEAQMKFFHTPGKIVSSPSELPEAWLKEIQMGYDRLSRKGG